MVLALLALVLAAIPAGTAQRCSAGVNPMCQVAAGLVFPSTFNKTSSGWECSNGQPILSVCQWD